MWLTETGDLQDCEGLVAFATTAASVNVQNSRTARGSGVIPEKLLARFIRRCCMLRDDKLANVA
jgi:hypothetical protein